MGSLGLILLVVVVAYAEAQHTYDGRNGPHIFGPPGQQVYIRGQNEGPYQVNGVGGTFQNSPNRGEHVFTDEQGNTFVHHKNGGGAPGTHSISGPGLTAVRGPPGHPPGTTSSCQQPGLENRSPYLTVGPPGSKLALSRHSRETFQVSRPDRTVDFGSGGEVGVQRVRRSPEYVVSRPDRVVVAGGGNYDISRSRRDTFQVSRPDRTVVFKTDRRRRSPQLITGLDGRYVDQREDSLTAVRPDGRYVQLNGRQRRDISDGRVQGENFVARDDQAGVWNDQVSIWRRPDGRTVTLDAEGNAIVSGRGRAPQHYSG